MEFDGKVAIVTGGASGIGAACALEFARGGADVCIVDIAPEELLRRQTLALKEAGARVVAFSADVSDHVEAGRVVEETCARLGRLDILVNAAGTYDDAPLWEMSEARWTRVLDVNLKGTFNYLQAAARFFREQHAGKIVNIASIEALRGRFGLSNYAASKAGVIALTRSAAAELGGANVNVNAVAPGFIRTPMTARLPRKILEEAIARTLLGRAGEAEEVAQLVAFLCSERAAYITGEVFKIDGGLLV
ncbi:MAG TPA: SDR family NAD(P)-dependent oxidoreductase [Pyrinomonadaceae bacterium]|nr:SDR family NAD(P)-dependent oxidoreductase [Pyrinomonadaceae bacterium]